MSGENRTAIITKLVKVAKKHYPAVSPPANRSVLENLLYACLLENSSFAAADEAFARLEQYSDWNEVRVTTTQELCELAAALSDPLVAVERLKLALHSIFEAHYLFELDFLLKENQGKAVAQLEKYKGVTPFVVSYLVQNSFGGHKIPTCEASLDFAEALGLLTPKEKESGTIPGFERAVPKTKGPEFFSTVHQFAVDFRQNPQDKQVLARIKEVSADAVKRLDVATVAGKVATGKSDSGKTSADTNSGSPNAGGAADKSKAGSSKSAAVATPEAGVGSDSNKPSTAKKTTSVPEDKTASKSSNRAAGNKTGGGKSVDEPMSSGKAAAASPKAKGGSAAKPTETKAAAKTPVSKPLASKPSAGKPAPPKPVAPGKSPAGKPNSKPAAKAPTPPAAKKPASAKPIGSEKPTAAKVVPGKKKPR